MIISDKGIGFIKRKEGFRSRLYLCPAGKPTIGYGHVITDKDSYLKDLIITEKFAKSLLRNKVKEYEIAVNESVKINLTQYQYDALVSLCYNIGPSNFKRSSVLRYLNQCNFIKSADSFLMWVKIRNPKTKKLEESLGLINRRLQEKEIFMHGIYN